MEAEAAIAEAIRVLAGTAAEPLAVLPDEGVYRRASDVERLGRLVDALRLQAAAELAVRADHVSDGSATPRLTRRLGVVSAAQVLERAARVSQREATRRIRLGRLVSPRSARSSSRHSPP